MLPLTKILCPTDFSEPSYEALSTAVELAQHFGASLHLLHVIQPIPTLVGTPEMGPALAPSDDLMGFNLPLYRQKLEETALRSLQNLTETRIPDGLPVYPVVVYGDPSTEIASYAEKNEVDLVVICTHGRTGWRHLVFGSVAERVVRHISCPALTVRVHESKRSGG